MSDLKTIFRSYDVRGLFGTDLTPSIAYDITQAYVDFLQPQGVVAVGRDIRKTSQALQPQVIQALIEAGIGVLDVGECQTEELYFAVGKYNCAGGIMVTASHNPEEYAGLKLVRESAKPISGDSGLKDILERTEKKVKVKSAQPGLVTTKDVSVDYFEHVKKFVDFEKIKPLKVVFNANFGRGGLTASQILAEKNFAITCLDCTPTGGFPKGRPDPLIPARRQETSALVQEVKADLGVAWDSDGDRCFFWDENGDFIPAPFITALLVESLLKKYPHSAIITDIKAYRIVQDAVKNNGGKFIINKTGTSFIRERMRAEDAIFAGELSAHYYFRDNYYSDNGQIPLLMILEILSVSGQKLSELVAPWRAKYFLIDEENMTVSDPAALMTAVADHYQAAGAQIITIDGISVEYPDWRFSLRSSGTEPLVRLNLEANSQALLDEKYQEVRGVIEKLQ